MAVTASEALARLRPNRQLGSPWRTTTANRAKPTQDRWGSSRAKDSGDDRAAQSADASRPPTSRSAVLGPRVVATSPAPPVGSAEAVASPGPLTFGEPPQLPHQRLAGAPKVPRPATAARSYGAARPGPPPSVNPSPGRALGASQQSATHATVQSPVDQVRQVYQARQADRLAEFHP
jgi:hypothetical protein